MPVEKLNGAWLHPSRLPLGGGWDGFVRRLATKACSPPMKNFTSTAISGMPQNVPVCPVEREWDAVRFSVARDHGSKLLLWFVCENAHRPAKHGTSEYDVAQGVDQFASDPRIQKMMECYVQSYLQRKTQPAIADSIPTQNYDSEL